MRTVAFHGDAFEDFTQWHKTTRRCSNALCGSSGTVCEIRCKGIGKPEPLRNQLRGYWSRRINDQHRLVYKVTDVAIHTRDVPANWCRPPRSGR